MMSPTDVKGLSRPARWGLAIKLFATLVVLGAIAILATGVLGYFRARDALETAIFDQLTAARQTKTRQVENYFRTVQAELKLLASSKMVVDATREFRTAVAELDQSGTSTEMRQKVSNWYAEDFIPGMARVLGKEPALADYLPVGAAPYYLQYHYIVANPNPKERRKLVDDRWRRQRLQQIARRISSATARRRHDGRLLRPDGGRPQIRASDLYRRKGGGFLHLPSSRSLPQLKRRGRRRPLCDESRPVGYLPGGLRALRSVARCTKCFHGSTGD